MTAKGLSKKCMVMSNCLPLHWTPIAACNYWSGNLGSLRLVPITALWPKASWNWGLPDTSTHDHQWKLNPRPLDLESNALSTQPHASSLLSMAVGNWVSWFFCFFVFCCFNYSFFVTVTMLCVSGSSEERSVIGVAFTTSHAICVFQVKPSSATCVIPMIHTRVMTANTKTSWNPSWWSAQITPRNTTCQSSSMLRNAASSPRQVRSPVTVDSFMFIRLLPTACKLSALWEGMGDVGSARYELALLPPCPTISVLTYSNCPNRNNVRYGMLKFTKLPDCKNWVVAVTKYKLSVNRATWIKFIFGIQS